MQIKYRVLKIIYSKVEKVEIFGQFALRFAHILISNLYKLEVFFTLSSLKESENRYLCRKYNQQLNKFISRKVGTIITFFITETNILIW